MIKLSFTIKCFVFTIICLIILSYYELENIKIKEEIKSVIETEDISEQFNTTMSYVSQTNTSRLELVSKELNHFGGDRVVFPRLGTGNIEVK